MAGIPNDSFGSNPDVGRDGDAGDSGRLGSGEWVVVDEQLPDEDSPTVPPAVAARQPKGVLPSGQTKEEFNARSGRMPIKGMPTKPVGEALAHMAQIAALEHSIRMAMVNEATATSRTRKETEQAERAWLTEVLPAWASQRSTVRTRTLFFSGIPPSVRSVVWRTAIGNERGITRMHYDRSVAAVDARPDLPRTASEDFGGGSDSGAIITAGDLPHRRRVPSMAQNTRIAAAVRKAEMARTQIAVDVPRTHILNSQTPPPQTSPACQSASARSETPPAMAAGDFRGHASDSDAGDGAPPPRDTGSSTEAASAAAEEAPEANSGEDGDAAAAPSPVDEMPERVTTLLRAFVELQPDVGYVQGMSYLAAMLLFELPPPEAFVAFANLLASGHFPFFYQMNHRAMSAYFAVFEQGLETADKELAALLRVQGAVPQLYASEWFMTLFSRSLPLPLAQRCWDAYLGDRAMLYRFAIALVVSLKPHLVADPSDAVVVLTTLHRHPERVNSERIIQLATDMSSKLPSLTWLSQVEAVQTQPWTLQANATAPSVPR